ncbi:MAG: GspH/FimT family pseudopilin [Azoarcus sp.]|jgi:type II secretion system protein H|nr:GspH/FimT family pseudopilin [Azoarcus sp.]
MRNTNVRTFHRRGVAGFTMVELMVVVAIAAILITSVVPSFDHMRGSVAVKSAANELASGLQFARSEAIRRNTYVYFELDPGVKAWNVHTEAGGGDATYEINKADPTKGDMLLRHTFYNSRVEVEPNTARYLRFSPTGGVSEINKNKIASDTTPIVICLRSGKQDARRLQLSRAGALNLHTKC